MIEGPLLLSLLARAYRFTKIDSRPPEPAAQLTVRSRTGIWLEITRR